MDIKHRKAYARIKIVGVGEPIILNEGMSLVRLLQQVLVQMANAANRYQGGTIEYSFEPIGKELTSQELAMREIYSGLDMSLVEQATDEEEQEWLDSPMNPQSPNYDHLFHEYINCGVTSHRQTKLPSDLTILRNHVESTYTNTKWWNGSHRW